jgi:hypothetical protein
MTRLLTTAAIVASLLLSSGANAAEKDTNPSLVYTTAVMVFSGRYCSNTSQLQPMKDIADEAYANSDQDLLDASNAKIAKNVAKMGLKAWCNDTKKAIPFS